MTTLFKASNPFTAYVYELCQKYKIGNDDSFANVPTDSEDFRKFEKFRDRYFKEQQKIAKERGLKEKQETIRIGPKAKQYWERSKEFNELFDRWITPFNTEHYTTYQITELANKDPELTKNGQFQFETTFIRQKLKNKGLRWRRYGSTFLSSDFE